MSLFPDDMIHTDKIKERIEEIESDHMDDDYEPIPADQWDAADRAEHAGLSAVIEVIGESNARNGVTLINEDYFDQYIREYYMEAGGEYHEYDRDTYGYRLIPLDELYSREPFNHIDWKAVAADHWSAYTPIEIDGTTYVYQEA
jgi:hypothetical protein